MVNHSFTMPYISIQNADKRFKTPEGKVFEVLNGVNLDVKESEFVSIIGHSGCGKSTLLNMVGGFLNCDGGTITVGGKPVKGPGPDRMFVFQNHSLLPWLTVRENVHLSVDAVHKNLTKRERETLVEEHLKMVSLIPAADKFPGEISGGMKQRVGIARALAVKPRVLMLDEPFGALDALTRGRLQEQLLEIWEAHRITVMMVTHDVEEALFLSDRIVMMANGPRARVGEIMKVELPRPRKRAEAIKHPNYYRQRNELLYFLNKNKHTPERKRPVRQERTGPRPLRIGFIPLSDCAPLVVAKEMGYFQKHGLDVVLSRESSWKAVQDGIIEDRLDLATMVAGMPLGKFLGINNTEPYPLVTSMVLGRNGNAITLARKFHDEGVATAADLKEWLSRRNGARKPIFGMVFPSSMHNLILRNWLASGGIDPDHDVDIIAVPPPQMVANLKAGNIDGYCVGEPWNARAVHEGLGYVVATDLDLYPGHQEKVLGTSRSWAHTYPEVHSKLVQALLEACAWCDDMWNREEIISIISRKEYVNADPIFSSLGLGGSYNYGFGRTGSVPNFNVFSKNNANYADKTEALWILTQLTRWSLVPFPDNCKATIDSIYLDDVYLTACRELGFPIPTTGYRLMHLPDGRTFDPSAPLAFLEAETIKREITNTVRESSVATAV